MTCMEAVLRGARARRTLAWKGLRGPGSPLNPTSSSNRLNNLTLPRQCCVELRSNGFSMSSNVKPLFILLNYGSSGVCAERASARRKHARCPVNAALELSPLHSCCSPVIFMALSQEPSISRHACVLHADQTPPAHWQRCCKAEPGSSAHAACITYALPSHHAASCLPLGETQSKSTRRPHTKCRCMV
jgi:hypothetical protein